MREAPPPLPPEQRTVGQLVAESIRAYGDDFWRALPLGLPLAVADQAAAGHALAAQSLVYWLATPLFAAAYLWACRLVLGGRPTRTAAALAVVIWLPFPALRSLFVLPGLAWLAFAGLAVPAATAEGTGFRASLVRGRQLARAGFAHVLGSLCALVVVVGVAAGVLGTLLHTQSASSARVATFLSDLVLSPLLYLGAAILYVDQSARLRSRHAGVHPPLEADAAGRADARVEP